ncbi:MAG: ABC transporter ATP-binding protein, partial [Clostridia bacterium]|nr:ABC transporter ATP-binding protein [Clostridia bacterium]
MSSAKKAKMNGAQTRRIVGIIFRYLKKYKALFALTLVMNVILVAETLYVPILVGRAIDMAVGRGNVDFEGIFRILVTIGIIAVVDVLLQWLINVCNNRIAFGTARRLRRDAFAKIQELPLSYIDTKPVGDVVSRVV